MSLSQLAQRMKKLDRMGLERTADGKKYNLHRHGTRIGAANANDGGWVDGKMTAAPLIQRGDPVLSFSFSAAEPLGIAEDVPVLQLCNVGHHYQGCDDAVLQDVDLAVLPLSRIAVVGKNGTGKSTLAELLAGSLIPTSGEVRRQRNLRVAHF